MDKQQFKKTDADSAGSVFDSVVVRLAIEDSVIKDSLRKQSAVQSKVDYQAADSIVFDLDSSRMILYQQAKVKFEKNELEAYRIIVDWSSSLVEAFGSYDTAGQRVGNPVFKENDQLYYAARMQYNFKTKKGKINYARTQTGNDYLLGETIRRENDSTYFIRNGRFTTCDAAEPHYYIRSRKLKVIPGDRIISGSLYMVIEEVPLPIVLPFGFFPYSQGRRSGIILPVPGEARDRGFFLRNGGFYWAASPYWDLTLRGDIFSKGGYRLEAGTQYVKRYRYNGSFRVQYAFQKFNERTDFDYTEQKNFFVEWTHRQTFSPTANLNSNVRLGSSSFLRQNSYSVTDYLTNQLQSSIAFSKVFANTPWAMTITGNHSQDVRQQTFNLNVPNIVLTRTRTFPFRNENKVGAERFYERIGVDYNANFQNAAYNIPDSEAVWSQLLNRFRSGLIHNIAISNNLKLFRYITITPGISYREYWYYKTIEKNYKYPDLSYPDSLILYALNTGIFTIPAYRATFRQNPLITHSKNGFVTARDFSFSVSATTTIYGIRRFSGPAQRAIRHKMIPSVGFQYKPDFSDLSWGFYRQVRNPVTGSVIAYSRFEEGIVGGPSGGLQQAISFNVQNIVEMKYIPQSQRNDTGKKQFKYINLLDNIGFSGNYNFAADSFRLSVVAATFRTNILNKLNITANANFDPYAVNAAGQRINKYQLEQDRLPARMTLFNLSIGTSLSAPTHQTTVIRPPSSIVKNPDYEQIMNYRDQYIDFKIPWSVNISYNFVYTRPGLAISRIQSVSLSGELRLTEKWRITGTTGYDIVIRKPTFTTFSILRDLHCWELFFTAVPFGFRQSYQLEIRVKSPTLRDLKLQKRRDWQDRFRNAF